ncbi:hypothetical protein BDZ90DRAFT_230483 [Jaminaea rosea]|uniref:Uncharacterized protein n=1 Tax=Jaminaea rosea TaxID=1569628 RepID=A0A316V2G2_9BASI|nr:hypothetical protein BDZ90DRAFT_230483 [Jaminaea rosea]PWN29615.1 hypothetical protein BDZ90DRAFT_230483 [Jaminaea rosea]
MESWHTGALRGLLQGLWSPDGASLWIEPPHTTMPADSHHASTTPNDIFWAFKKGANDGGRPLSSLCPDKEGWGPFSPVRSFDLSPCFQQLTLWIGSALVLSFCASFELSRLSRKPERTLTPLSRILLGLKHALVIVAAIATLPSIIVGLHSHTISLYAGIVTLVGYLLAIPLQGYNHTRTRSSSTILLFYWLAHTAFAAAWVRTYLNRSSPYKETLGGKSLLALFIARSVIIAIVFAIECAGVEVGQKKGDGKVNPVSHQVREGSAINGLGGSNGGENNGSAFGDVGADPEAKVAYSTGLDKECPENTANIFSRLSFWWMNPMMKLGASKYLTENDLWSLPPGEDSESLGDKFDHYYKTKRTSDGAPKFWTALTYSFGGTYVIAGILKAVQDSLAFIQPQLLRRLLQFVSTWDDARRTEDVTAEPAGRGFIITFGLFFVAVTQTAVLHNYFQRCFVTGMRVRAGLISAIYKKSLRLSNDERGTRSTGEIVNLMSVDATRLQDLCTYGHIIWSSVFQMLLAFISLYNLLGWPAFAGVLVMVFSIPLNTMLAKYMRSLAERNMKVKDKRTKMMNEILTNIKSIKLFAWEEAFTKKLFEVRNGEELKLLRWAGAVNAFFNFFWSAIPFFVSLATFITYSITSDKPLTADVIFPALSLYQLLQFPLAMFAGIVTAWIQALVSARRLASFLDAGELDENARVVEVNEHEEDPNAVAEPPTSAQRYSQPLVELKDADFKWAADAPMPTLQDLNLSVRKGELLAVLGKVGDGKSSLLSAILGEMYRSDGQCYVRGRTAYFTQGGWAMGATIRDNILFGLRYEEEFYQRVIKACALEPDFAIMQDGDQTEIGEKGVSLSGGQRARVALARACYARADIYLLDDPLAAVDAHVGAHIFKHVIGPEGMLKSKARILTTNMVSFLPQVDQIVSFRRGILMDERGTYDEVMARKGDLYALITGLGKQSDRRQQETEQGNGNEDVEAGAKTPSSQGDSDTLRGSSEEELELKLSRRMSSASMHRPKTLTRKQVKQETMRQLREASLRPAKEANAQGSVSWDVYKRYASSASASGLALFGYFAAHIGTQVLQVGRDIVLKQWGSYNDTHQGGTPGDARFYLSIYAVVGIGASIAVCIGPFILYVYLVIASARHWHDSMFHAVLRSPLQWFEATPVGVSLNRFSKDVNAIDETLPRVLHGFFRTLVVVAGVLIVISASVPPFLIAIIPLYFAYRAILRYYLATSRELKRLDAVSKSPIFSWFQESLGGLSTIRAFGQSERFIATNETRVDRNQQAYFPSVSTNRWLAVRIEFMGAMVILTASSLAVALITRNISGIDAGLVGLMMSQALSTTQALNWVVRSASEVEQNIVSVERAIQYAELSPEAPYESGPDNAPPREWPTEGAIEFKDYSTRYREHLPLVLKKLSLSIKPGERIGVVGRTGAGKSSLTLALFRIIEATGGSIVLDGVDTSTIGLKELRSSIAIIPQDACLWGGSLRDNLDPTGASTDQALWRALEQAKLKDHVQSMKGQLDAELSEGASNFSAGQRQLICIARALLRGAKVLVLDEATSSIDLETDEYIQKIVREQFHGTTITVAHRLPTILESDRVLVLKDGALAEFASPKDLLSKRDSIFYSMAVEAGAVSGVSGGGSK